MPESEGAMSETPHGESCTIQSHTDARNAAAAAGNRMEALNQHSYAGDHTDAAPRK